MTLSTACIRKKFIDYFVEQSHEFVESSSSVAYTDPSLLFTNAGMNQFKDVFLGNKKPIAKKVVTCQKCIRAGGKHNDIENVGFTNRHHTFFEMLGNFSFGDYFKEQAIFYAFDFLINELKIPKEKLVITVYKEDQKSYEIWQKQIKIAPDKIIKIATKDNFWSMGDTGPCGPCTEIFYDHGKKVKGGLPGSETEDGDRFVEIWNIVFMQYNKTKDGKLEELKMPCVDTGMGLERISAVLQNVHSNYQTDAFCFLKQEIKNTLKIDKNITQKNIDISLNVISDHIRSCVILLNDNLLPANEGAGYVLRKIIRRALVFIYKLGITDAVFYKLTSFVKQSLGDFYQDLSKSDETSLEILKTEEEQFLRTLSKGIDKLNFELRLLKTNTLSGDIAFKLYDTYGFSLDITKLIAKEKNIQIDLVAFKKNMQEQKKRAQKNAKFSAQITLDKDYKSLFLGYEKSQVQGQIIAIFNENFLKVSSLELSQKGYIILDKTCLYPEGGGQLSDLGNIFTEDFDFEVLESIKQADAIIHKGKVLKGKLNLNTKVCAKANTKYRNSLKIHHSATHLLHFALRELISPKIEQKGSLVRYNSLRFDFSYAKDIAPKQILSLENLINNMIQENAKAQTKNTSYENALNEGAIALFGEKYDKQNVRVVSLGKSVELCSGMHVENLLQIGVFKIINTFSVASGIRRIEAVCSCHLLDYFYQNENLINQIASSIKADKASLEKKFLKHIQDKKQLEKNYQNLQNKVLKIEQQELLEKTNKVANFNFLFENFSSDFIKNIHPLMNQIISKKNPCIVFLYCFLEDKTFYYLKLSKELTQKLSAKNILLTINQITDAKGGGKDDFATAQGISKSIFLKNIEKIKQTLITQITK